MLGVPDASESARESICVIDDRTAGRLRAAGRRHVLRSARSRSTVLTWTVVLGVLPVLFRRSAGGWAETVTTALALLPVGFLLALALVWLTVTRGLDSFTRRELQPGRLLGLTVGSHSVRVRDHDSSHEVTYDAIEAVEQHRDVVVVVLGDRFWLLPMELFAPVTLTMLRERAGRRPAPGPASAGA